MPHFDTPIQARFHKPWAAEREQTIAKLYDSRGGHDPEGWDDRDRLADKTAAKIAKCGRYASCYRGRESGKVIISGARCKSRMCPRCNAIRAKQLEAAILERVNAMDSPRMITLTLEHQPETCDKMTKRLVKSFRNLRRSKVWKRKISGGVAVIEIARNKRTNRWHAHMHILADGEYWAQASISQAWAQASGGSRIVDVRAIHKRSSASRYVSKYVAKCKGPDSLNSDETAELCEAMHGLRQVQTFGTMHGRTTPAPEPKTDTHTDHIVPLGPFVRAEEAGDVRASRILHSLRLCTRLRVEPSTGMLTRRDINRSGQATKRAGHWWFNETENTHEHTTRQTDDPPGVNRSPDRTQRHRQNKHDARHHSKAGRHGPAKGPHLFA